MNNVCAIVEPDPADAPVMPPVTVPILHVKVEAAVEVSGILVVVALQIATAELDVTTGVGFTVTVMVCAGPWQAPAIEVGTTIYWIVPAVVLLGLVRVWAIVAPDPAVAPVIPPVTVPTVQAKVLAALAVKLMLVAVLLHIAAVFALVITGVGCTVTSAVMLKADPTQPSSEVGVTRYSTVPELTVLGLFNIWLITLPEPALAPVIPPLMVPIVQVKVLGTDAVS